MNIDVGDGGWRLVVGGYGVRRWRLGGKGGRLCVGSVSAKGSFVRYFCYFYIFIFLYFAISITA
jgi:hypothetical protein